MRELCDIDVLSDGAMQARLLRWSVGLFVASLAAVVAVGVATGGDGGSATTPWWWAALGAGALVPLPVHELVHAAAFRLASPGCRVSFGREGAFLYTRAEGAVVPRRRMVAVLLAPAVVLTAALVAAGAALGVPTLGALAAATHLSGCAGDAVMVLEISREPACTHVRDTATGVILLSDGPE